MSIYQDVCCFKWRIHTWCTSYFPQVAAMEPIRFLKLLLMEWSRHLIATLHVSSPSRHCCCNCLLINTSAWHGPHQQASFFANTAVIFNRVQLELSGQLLIYLVHICISLPFTLISSQTENLLWATRFARFSGARCWMSVFLGHMHTIAWPRGCMWRP